MAAVSSAPERPRVGVGVFVLNRKGEFVLGKRKGSHGAGTWALPGGHLEQGESFEHCAEREVLEETGLEIQNVRFLTATNSPNVDGNHHYVTIFMIGELAQDEMNPILMEPNKCEGWDWVTWEQLVGWARPPREQDFDEEMEEERKGRNGRQRLFLPLMDLLRQRPGWRPNLAFEPPV